MHNHLKTSQTHTHKKKQTNRACLYCSLVKTEEQFVENGCANCESYMPMKGDIEQVRICTTAQFEGYVFELLCLIET